MKLLTYLFLPLMILITSCNEDIITINPIRPAVNKKIDTVIEWNPQYPDEKQKGEFLYDNHDRLIQYNFYRLDTSGLYEKTMYHEYKYSDNGLEEFKLYWWNWITHEWINSTKVTYITDDAQKVIEAIEYSLSDRGDSVYIRKFYYEYNSNDQVKTIRIDDDEIYKNFYDDKGNVKREEKYFDNIHALTTTYSYDKAWNPLQMVKPLNSGINIIGIWNHTSVQIANAFENSEPGKEPAAKGYTSVEVDDDDYPVRIDIWFYSTQYPEAKNHFISEYTYK